MRPARHFAAAAALVLAGALAAGCGGGAAAPTVVRDPTPTPEPQPPPPEPQPPSPEPEPPPPDTPPPPPTPSWNLLSVGAAAAYVNLAAAKGDEAVPGAGVTIGFLDTGLHERHSAFAGGTRTVEEVLLQDGAGDSAADLARDRSFSHGTAVAGVAAGADSGGRRWGVAPGANVRMFAIRLGSGTRPYRAVSLTGLESYSRSFAGYLNRALAGDVDVLNASLSIPGVIDHYSEADLRARIAPAFVQAAAQSGVADKTILVWAAGNYHGSPCTGGPSCVDGRVDARSVAVSAGLPKGFPELRGHWIAAVAVDRDGGIAGFSNRCGSAAEWCLAAPGARVPILLYGYREDSGLVLALPGTADGTSLAAPMIAGGLAVMKQIFRGQLSGTALVSRLFATARKTGRYADRSVYGQGLMDLGAATAPVGAMTIAGGGEVEAGGAGLRETGLTLGRAFGDGLALSLAGREIAAFDALGAPFWFDLGSLVGAAPGPSAADRLHALTAPARHHRPAPERVAPIVANAGLPGSGRLRAGLLDMPPAAGHLALAGRAAAATLDIGGGLAAAAFTDRRSRPRISGTALSWRPPGAPAGVTAGWLTERGELLGARAAGAFGGLSADTRFARLQSGFESGPWSLAAAAEIGTSVPRYRRALLADMSALVTTAFALDMSRRLPGGRMVGITLAQPLRVEHGRAVLSVPVGRTQAGAVLRRAVVAGLEPSGRQIDVALRWRRTLRTGGEIGLGAAWTHDPGHVAGAAPGVAAAAAWRLAF